MKKIKSLICYILAMIIIITNINSISAAEGTGLGAGSPTDVTNLIEDLGQDSSNCYLEYYLKNDLTAKPYTSGTTLDIVENKIDHFTLHYGFALKDYNEGTSLRKIKGGDYYTITLPKELKFTTLPKGQIVDSPSDGSGASLIAEYEVVNNNSEYLLKVTFAPYIDDYNTYDIKGAFGFDFTLDDSVLNNHNPQTISIPINPNSNIDLKIDNPQKVVVVPTGLDKSVAKYSADDKTIVWKLEAQGDSPDVAGCTFTDTIDLVNTSLVSVKFGGRELSSGEYTYTTTSGDFSYTVPSDYEKGEDNALYITVKVKDLVYLKVDNTTISNTGKISDGPIPPGTTFEDTATQLIEPEFLSKAGTKLSGNEILWTITVNSNQVNIYDVVVTDKLSDDVEYKPGSLKVNNVIVSDNGQLVNPGDYATLKKDGSHKELEIHLNNTVTNASTKKLVITLITTLKKNEIAATTDKEYTNQVAMTCKYTLGDGTGTDFTPADITSDGVAMPYVDISKSGKLTDKKTGEITWDIVSVSNVSEYGKSTIVDTIPADQDFKSLKIKDSDGKYTEVPLYKSSITEKIYYEITGDADSGQVITITFTDDNALQEQVQLQVVTTIDRSIYGTNIAATRFTNKASVTLYKQGANGVSSDNALVFNEANATVEVSNTVIEKTAKTYEGNTGGNGETPRINFEIVINHNSMDLKNVLVTDSIANLETTFTPQNTNSKWKNPTPALDTFLKWQLVPGSIKVYKMGSSDTEEAGLSTKFKDANDALKTSLEFNFGNISDKYRITYTLELVSKTDDQTNYKDILNTNGTFKCLKNSAAITSADLKSGGTTAGPTTSCPEINNYTLQKLATSYDGEGVIRWSININQHLFNKYHVIEDLLPEGLSLDPSAGVKVYTNVINKNGEFVDADDLSAAAGIAHDYRYVKDDATGRYLLAIDMPEYENQSCIVVFYTLVPSSWTNQTISNSVKFSGAAETENGNTNTVTYKNNNTGSSTKRGSVVITKTSNDTGESLAGAVFEVYWINGEEKVLIGETAPTNSDGKVTYRGLNPGQQYYIIEKTPPDNYVKDNNGITILAAAGSSVSADSASPPVKTGTWTIEGTKVLKNTTNTTKLTSNEYRFELRNAEGTKIAEGTNDANGKITFTKDSLIGDAGYANYFTFSGSYAFDENDPTGTRRLVHTDTFTVTEIAGNNNDITYDGETKTVTANYYNVKGTADLVVEVNEGVNPIFTNVYNASGDITLSLTKNLTGKKMDGEEFEFELYEVDNQNRLNLIQTIRNGAGSELSNNISTSINSFAPITYKLDKDTQDVSDVISTHKYVVKEKIETKAGYAYDRKEYSLNITVTDEGNGSLKAVSDVLNENIIFNNTYSASNVTYDFFDIDATKTLEGKSLNLSNQDFTFTLNEVDVDGNLISIVSSSIKANKDTGIIENFPLISFTQQDMGKTFYYTLVENNDGATGYNYDSSVYKIDATIRDNGDGTLVVRSTISLDGNAVDNIRFVNKYTSQGSLKFLDNISITKELEGKDLEAGQFEFLLTEVDKNGNAIASGVKETVTNDINGKITFSELKYTQDHIFKNGSTGKTSYYYTISEIDGRDSEYTYDENVYMLKVDLEDKDDGSIVVTKAILQNNVEVDSIHFFNVYTEPEEEQIGNLKPGESVETGDDNNIVGVFIMLMLSFGMGLLAIRRRKEEI